MPKGKTIRVAAVPPARSFDYVLWDGTDPVDSHALGKGLAKLGWTNQVDPTAQFARKDGAKPAVLQPAGPLGFDADARLMWRGMFELPQAVFGKPLTGEANGHAASIIAVSGHGVPGFMFSESVVPIVMSRPMSTPATSWGALGGAWSYDAKPTWPSKTKVVILSACRQLQGMPQQDYWSRTMRSSTPLHAILSYRNTGPSAVVSAGINQVFLRHLKGGQTFLKAWRSAHSSPALSRRWAALCHEASLGDTLAEWMTKGHFAKEPKPIGKILYFDSDTPNGREVKTVAPDLDCWLTTRGGTGRMPPWFLFPNGIKLDLHIKILKPGEQILPDDRIMIVASQVRPDYSGPFSIENLFTIEGEQDLKHQGLLITSQQVHQGRPDHPLPAFRNGNDAYEVFFRPGNNLIAHGPEIVVPIQLVSSPNEHLPVFYLYAALEGQGGRRFGFHETSPVEDRFQYCVFRLLWNQG